MLKALTKEDFNRNAKIYKIMSNPIRLEVLHSLQDGEKAVEKILKNIKIRKSALSQHLAILRNTNLVDSRRSGKNIIYSLNRPELLRMCFFLSNPNPEKDLK